MEKYLYKGLEIEIQRRAFQKSVNILVKPSGQVKMTMGKTVSKRRIKGCLDENEDWLSRVLDKINELKRKFPVPQYNQGDQLLFMGRRLTLHVISSIKKRPEVEFVSNEIHLKINSPETIKVSDKKKSIQKFYKTTGIEILKKVVDEQSHRMNLFPKKVTFRSQKTRWGSCSSAGHLSLNWKLIFSPPETIEYVVIHELAHLVHQNHSQRFWDLVANYSPNFQEHKKWLNLNQNEIASYEY